MERKRRYIEQYEFDNYMSVRQRIMEFSAKVITRLEEEYPDVVDCWQGLVVEDFTIINDDYVQIFYFCKDDVKKNNDLFVSIEDVLNGDVDVCCRNMVEEFRSELKPFIPCSILPEDLPEGPGN